MISLFLGLTTSDPGEREPREERNSTRSEIQVVINQPPTSLNRDERPYPITLINRVVSPIKTLTSNLPAHKCEMVAMIVAVISILFLHRSTKALCNNNVWNATTSITLHHMSIPTMQ
jgi:hypothetical protein